MLTVSMPWPSADLSPNGRVNPFQHHKAKKSAKNYAWAITKELCGPLGIVPGSWVGPIEITYTFHPNSARTRDDDNFAGRMKAARDGIALALGVDDSTFRQMPVVFAAKRKPACVVITLTPAAVKLPIRGQIA